MHCSIVECEATLCARLLWGTASAMQMCGCAGGSPGLQGLSVPALLQVVCEVGKAVGAEGLVAGQIVDIKSEGMAEQVSCRNLATA